MFAQTDEGMCECGHVDLVHRHSVCQHRDCRCLNYRVVEPEPKPGWHLPLHVELTIEWWTTPMQRGWRPRWGRRGLMGQAFPFLTIPLGRLGSLRFTWRTER